MQLQFCKIQIKFEKIQLLFIKYQKKCLNCYLESTEYSDTCIWKFWDFQQEKFYVLGNWSFMQLHVTEHFVAGL